MDLSKEYPINVAYMHGSERGHSCGYCKNKTGSFTYGFDTTSMKPEVYKGLMDCGWRRCGSYFYKPDLFKSCCKSYTIRMNATQFQIKKSQKKVMKKWNKFIYSKDGKASETKMQEEPKKPQQKQDKTTKVNKSFENIKKVDYNIQDEQQQELKELVISLAQACEVSKSLIINELNNPAIEIAHISFIKKEIMDVFKILPSKCIKKGQYFTNYFMLFFAKNKEALLGTKSATFVESCQGVLKPLFEQFVKDYQYEIDLNGQVNFFVKTPTIRKSSLKIEQIAQEVNNDNSVQPPSKSQLTVEQSGQLNVPSKPEIPAIKCTNSVSSISKMQVENEGPAKEQKMEEEKQNADTSIIKETVQKTVEFIKRGKGNLLDDSMKKDKADDADVDNYNNFHWDTDKFTATEVKRGRLTIKIQLAKCDDQNFGMYQRYCQDIHDKSKESRDGFKGFLCEKTIAFNMKTSEINKEHKLLLGCFHMNYYLDNEFIAVGVVDIFEDNLSSVYFYYEPKYSVYSLGVVGAIYEIEYVRQLNQFFPKFQYYYLGFYIQDCQKMVYKGDYGPGELLCPRTYKWFPLDEKTRKFIDSKPKDPSLASPQEQIDARMSHSTNLNTLQKFVEEKTRTSFQGQIIPSKQFFQFFQQSLKNTFVTIASVIDQNLYPTLLFDFSQK